MTTNTTPKNHGDYAHDSGTAVVAFMTAIAMTEVFGKAWYDVTAGEDYFLALKAHPEHEALLRQFEHEPSAIEAFVTSFGSEHIPLAVQLVGGIAETARTTPFSAAQMDEWYESLLAFYKENALPRDDKGAPIRKPSD